MATLNTEYPKRAIVSIILLPFNNGDINTWFLQVQAVFETKHITSQWIEFSHVINLQNIVTEMTDILENILEDIG